MLSLIASACAISASRLTAAICGLLSASKYPFWSPIPLIVKDLSSSPSSLSCSSATSLTRSEKVLRSL